MKFFSRVEKSGEEGSEAEGHPKPSCSTSSLYLDKDRMLLIPDRNCTSSSHTHVSKNTEGNIKQNWRRQSARFYCKLTAEIQRSIQISSSPCPEDKLNDATLLQGQTWKIHKSFAIICKDLSQWGLWCWQKIILHLFL